jgi:hypothetical protein
VLENPEASDLVELAQNLVFHLDDAVLAPFRRAWAQTQVMRSAPERPRAAPLPVLQWWGRIAENADPDSLLAPLIAKLHQCRSALPWRQTYTLAEANEQFLSNYGYTELVGSTAAVRSDKLAVGFLVLGPHTFYPKHRHEAEEIYVPLSGTAEWLQGDGIWRSRRPGTIIHHQTHESHAMRTGVQPLLALYLWLSDTLNQKASLE